MSEYFEKAVSLVLSSAGITSIEKQALHLLAAEAERYAHALGEHAGRIAQVSQRSECTAADLETAAACFPIGTSTREIFINPDAKRKLRLSMDRAPCPDVNTPNIRVVHLDSNSTEAAMAAEHVGSPRARKSHVFPEWMQKQIETSRDIHRASTPAKNNKSSTPAVGPLSQISSLVLAEEEARSILTKRLKTEKNQQDQSMLGPN